MSLFPSHRVYRTQILNRIKPRVQADDIIEVFHQCFAEAFSTTLCGGADEPYYEVHDDKSAVIYFSEDFVASALHEVAHWCLAGRERLKLSDYGYWYEGARDEAAQKRFEAVEVRPQALEWIFAMTLQLPFRVSADNLYLKGYDNEPFRRNVRDAAEVMLTRGLCPRGKRFAEALNALVDAPKNWCEIRHRLDVTEVPK